MSLSYFVTPNSATKAVSLTARVRQNSGRFLGLTALAFSMAACNTIPKADTRPACGDNKGIRSYHPKG